MEFLVTVNYSARVTRISLVLKIFELLILRFELKCGCWKKILKHVILMRVLKKNINTRNVTLVFYLMMKFKNHKASSSLQYVWKKSSKWNVSVFFCWKSGNLNLYPTCFKKWRSLKELWCDTWHLNSITAMCLTTFYLNSTCMPMWTVLIVFKLRAWSLRLKELNSVIHDKILYHSISFLISLINIHLEWNFA